MFKKSLSFILVLAILVTSFCGLNVSAATYYGENNRLIFDSPYSYITNEEEVFATAKSKNMGLTLKLGDYILDFNKDMVEDINIFNDISVTDETSNYEVPGKVYEVSGLNSGLLKVDHNGIINITFPYTLSDSSKIPVCANIDSNNVINYLYTKYDSKNNTVTVRADKFGLFYIYDGDDSDFGFGKMAISFEENADQLLSAYEVLEQGLLNFDSTIYMPSGLITVEDLSTVYNALSADNPFIYAINITEDAAFNGNIMGYSMSGGYVTKIYPNYGISKAKYEQQVEQIKAAAKPYLEGIDVDRIGEYEASRIIYERLCDTITYVLDAPYCHTLYGSLVNNEAVCDGISKAYQYLLNQLGIVAHIAVGDSHGEGHAWNLVRINGEYYYTDVTWADQVDIIFYSYLNLSYNEVSIDHNFENVGYYMPATTATKDNYYNVTGKQYNYSSLTGNNLFELSKKYGFDITFKVNNYSGSSLGTDIKTKLTANSNKSLYDIMGYFNLDGIRYNVSYLGKEAYFYFYNDDINYTSLNVTINEQDYFVGDTMSINLNGASLGSAYKIQWYRNGIAIDGATNTTYKLTIADIDRSISVAVYKEGYNGFAFSNQSSLVNNSSCQHSFSNSCDTTCNLCGLVRVAPHNYTNACDESCNTCGLTREAYHTYSNDCDEICNVCNYARTDAHKYSNSCDSTCNLCGKTRVTSHTYSNNCDVFCDICFEPRTPNDHQYTNLCDDTCNECYETRVAPHKFDSPCDSTCGLCGLTRTAPHKFDNDCDEECNICGDIREVEHKSKYVLDKKASFDEHGKAHYECEKCGETLGKVSIAKLDEASLSTTTYTYNGKVKSPEVTITDLNGEEIDSKYYDVEFLTSAKYVGEHIVLVTFKGIYEGEVERTFIIKPGKTTIKKLTAYTKSIKVYINKKTTQTSGYQIEWSTSKKFTNSKKTLIKKNSTTTYTIKSLSRKKTYYVRVRCFKTTSSGKRIYGDFTTYKYTKTK